MSLLHRRVNKPALCSGRSQYLYLPSHLLYKCIWKDGPEQKLIVLRRLVESWETYGELSPTWMCTETDESKSGIFSVKNHYSNSIPLCSFTILILSCKWHKKWNIYCLTERLILLKDSWILRDWFLFWSEIELVICFYFRKLSGQNFGSSLGRLQF